MVKKVDLGCVNSPAGSRNLWPTFFTIAVRDLQWLLPHPRATCSNASRQQTDLAHYSSFPPLHLLLFSGKSLFLRLFSLLHAVCVWQARISLQRTEPGIIKVARSWYQWVFNFRWNIGKKFTPRKVHWFGILDPARYLPVPVVQSVTLPNSPIPSMRLIFSKKPSKMELIHGY